MGASGTPDGPFLSLFYYDSAPHIQLTIDQLLPSSTTTKGISMVTNCILSKHYGMASTYLLYYCHAPSVMIFPGGVAICAHEAEEWKD